jgi:hypothetical protein
MDGARNFKSGSGTLAGVAVALAGPRGCQAWIVWNDHASNTFDLVVNGQTFKVLAGEVIGLPLQADAASLNGTGAYRWAALDDAGALPHFAGRAPSGTGSIPNSAVTTDKLADVAVTAAKIAAAVAGAGLTGGAGSALAVQVDGVGVEIDSDTVRLKDGGVTPAKLKVGGLVTLADGAAAPTITQLHDSGLLSMTPTADRAVTLCSTADLITKLPATGSWFDFSLASLAAFALTVGAGDGDTTTVGSMAVGSAVIGPWSGLFRVIRTGATTVKVVRVA